MAVSPPGPALIEFELGFDRFVAQAIQAECEAAGLSARVLMMDNDGQSPGILALAPHRLLVAEGDAEAVSAIVHAWLSDDHPAEPAPRASSRRALRTVAVAMLAILVLGMLITIL